MHCYFQYLFIGWKYTISKVCIGESPSICHFSCHPPCYIGSPSLSPGMLPLTLAPQNSTQEHSGTWTFTFGLRQSQALYREGNIFLVWPRSGFVSLQLVGKSDLIYEEGRCIAWADTWLPWLGGNKRWNHSSEGLREHWAGFLMTVPTNIQSLSEACQDDQIALNSK